MAKRYLVPYRAEYSSVTHAEHALLLCRDALEDLRNGQLEEVAVSLTLALAHLEGECEAVEVDG